MLEFYPSQRKSIENLEKEIFNEKLIFIRDFNDT